MTEDMQVRNLSPHTQASYLQQVSLFARHFGKSPDALTPEHIRAYQLYLTNEKKLPDGIPVGFQGAGDFVDRVAAQPFHTPSVGTAVAPRHDWPP